MRRVAVRAALRPSSLVMTLLLVLTLVLAVRSDLRTRPIVRLEVDTGGPIRSAPAHRPAPSRESSPTHSTHGTHGTHSRPSAATLARYRVRPGDTLSGVAVLHDVPAAAVAHANHLSAPYALAPGRVLRIPDVAPGPPPPAPSTARTGVADLVAWWARQVRLSPALLQAVTWRESGWRQDAVSGEGAVGVGQVLPATAGWVAQRLAGQPLDPHVLDDNVQASARYLRWLIDHYDGDVAAALAAYHQGPLSVSRDGWLPTTQQYVTDVFHLRRAF